MPGRKWSEGLHFTNQAHDLYQLGDKQVPGKTYWYDKNKNITGERGSWTYKWESTAAYSGTDKNGAIRGTKFMKATNEYLKAGNKGY